MFKESFKYYKSRNPMPRFDDVLDLHKCSESSKIKPLPVNSSACINSFDLNSPSTWEVYEILDRPGFIYIKNPFTPVGQRYWIRQAIEEFTKKPNKLNIDIHSIVPPNKNWWDYSKQDKSVLKKLRWSTLGYHHNWDTKVYSEDSKNQFPDNLSRLCNDFSAVLGFKFNAEAAIVNFYHLDSTLSGHTDHSEEFLDAPLFSFSFGNTAIFLLGGPTVDEKPSAVFIHSGDVVIMSRQSRLSYHAVPRIMKTDKLTWSHYINEGAGAVDEKLLLYTSPKEFEQFNEYLEFSRINLNVRQVLQAGQTKLTHKHFNKECIP